MRRSSGLTRIPVLVGLASLTGLALAACNALSGASDLTIGEPGVDDLDAGASPDTREPAADAAPLPTVDDAAVVDAADAADASPCEPTGTVETVSANPTTAVDDARNGTIPWVVTSQSPLQARAEFERSKDVTHWLVTRGYGLAVPTPSVIRGITVVVRRVAGGFAVAADQGVALVRGTELGGPKTLAAEWGTDTESVTYGSATDPWGTPWMVADVTSATFGVAVAARNVLVAGRASSYVRVTAVTVRVSFERCK